MSGPLPKASGQAPRPDGRATSSEPCPRGRSHSRMSAGGAGSTTRFHDDRRRAPSPGAGVSTQAPIPDVFFGPFHPPPPASACWLRPHARLRPWSGRASVGALEDRNSRPGACGARANAASLNGRTSRSICSPGRSFHWFFRVSRASVESPAGDPPAAVLKHARQRQGPGAEEN